MKVETSGLPNVSSFVKPVISAVLSFHSFTMPFTSMPKMGALAWSMSWRVSSATAASFERSLKVSQIEWEGEGDEEGGGRED